jgi:hypothetical protein
MAFVVKHTFLEYRPPIPETSASAEEVNGFDDDHELQLCSRRRSRAFSDSEIKYSFSASLYSSLESCDTESTCFETASLSDAIGSPSSASSAEGDSPDNTSYFPNSPELVCREAFPPSWDFAESIGHANHQGSDDAQDFEDFKVKTRVLELNRDASDLMARALKAEEEAQQLRLQATNAPLCESSGGESTHIAVPVQMVQWVPVTYFTVGTFSNDSICTTAACEPKFRKERKGKANTRASRTTLMLRNIPNNYSRDMLMDLLDREGFVGCYNFIYLPVDFHRLAGLGYAFVNFTKIEFAEHAKQYFQGFDRWAVTSHKVCDVTWGEPLQGLDAHLDRYRNSPVMHEDVPEQYKPVYLQNGARQPFPLPTKRIRPPRIKRGGIPGMMPDFSAVPTVA